MALDWSQLHQDLLQLIAEKITSVADYVRFRAVCYSWRSQTSPCPRRLPAAQLPWLMHPYNPCPYDAHQRPFFDFHSRRVVRLELPETRVKWCCGSSHGWLVLKRGAEVSLLNPITRQQIQLPLLSHPPKVLRIPSSDATAPNDCVYMSDYACCFIEKAILSANPSLGSECVVMAVLQSVGKLAFCRVGDESWTIIHDPLALDQNVDVVCRDGRFYSVNHRGRVILYDIDATPSRALLTTESPLGEGRYLLVQDSSSSRELLMVLAADSQTWATDCRVFKMDLGEKAEWAEVHDIGERMLFLSGNDQCFSLSTSHLEGLRGNCISFAQYRYQDPCESVCYSICLFSLDDGRVVEILCDLEPFVSYWSPPVWVTPSLH